jgi:hypothetical protein
VTRQTYHKHHRNRSFCAKQFRDRIALPAGGLIEGRRREGCADAAASFRGEAEGREPGIQYPPVLAMSRCGLLDSGLAASRRPGMTEPGWLGNALIHQSSFMESMV